MAPILGPSMRGSVMDGLATSVVPTVHRRGLVRRGPPLRLASLGTSPPLRGVGGWAAALGAGFLHPTWGRRWRAKRQRRGVVQDVALAAATGRRGPRRGPDRGDGRRGMDPGYVVLRCAWTSFRDDEAEGAALFSPSSSRAKPERSGGADPGSMPRRSSKGGAVQATHRSFSIVPLDDLLRGMDPGYGVLRCAWTPFRDDEAEGWRDVFRPCSRAPGGAAPYAAGQAFRARP